MAYYVPYSNFTYFPEIKGYSSSTTENADPLPRNCEEEEIGIFVTTRYPDIIRPLIQEIAEKIEDILNNRGF